MKVEIGNDIKVYNISQPLLEWVGKNLLIDNPDYLIAKRLGRRTYNLPEKMKLYVRYGNDYVLPFGCIRTIWDYIKNSEIKLNFHGFLEFSMVGNIKLYDYQEKAKNQLILKKNGILEAPCGSGKTQIGLQLIKEIGGRALWLTHTTKLLEQSKERAMQYFKGDFGTITDGAINIGKDITFATVQTMSKIDSEIYKNAFDVVVVDECHHCVGSPTMVKQFYKIVSNCNCRYKYGLSATLSRADNLIQTLYSIIGEVIYTIDKEEVGDKIIKAKHIPIEIDLQYDYMDYLNYDGTLDYSKLINTLSFRKDRNSIIVNKVFEEFQNGKKQLILCHRVEQVCQLSREIEKFCKVSSLTGRTQKKDREYNADVIVATYSLAKEGLDIPTLDILHLATPQKNESITKQSVGRIERNTQGKKQPICYDYVDINIDYCKLCFRKRKRMLK